VRRRLLLSPNAFARVALIALVLLTLIVLTGAGVRLTGSGLGCPDWPKCYGKVIAPLETHAIIEWGNRVLSGFVGLGCAIAGLAAFLRRPFRRDLAAIGLLLPLGVVMQAVLGAFTVKYHLAPGFVMGHFALSLLILIAAVALAWRARHEPGERPRSSDRLSVWAIRALLPIGAVTIFVGTAATAAGPHAGGAGTGDEINRLTIEGADTLEWAISQHARIAAFLGILAVAVWFIVRRRGADRRALRPMTVLVSLLAVQGLIGIGQYALELPSELVWVHVSLATITWVVILWAVAAAGRLESRTSAEAVPAVERPREPVELAR
jgi:heme a synthase